MSKPIAIGSLDEFVYGVCPKPVTTKRGLELGTGLVFPEVNFTLPCRVRKLIRTKFA
jgi:methanol--5-hydroxybenzimidazolylcobamide Co-methyltransferase